MFDFSCCARLAEQAGVSHYKLQFHCPVWGFYDVWAFFLQLKTGVNLAGALALLRATGVMTAVAVSERHSTGTPKSFAIQRK